MFSQPNKEARMTRITTSLPVTNSALATLITVARNKSVRFLDRFVNLETAHRQFR